MKRRKSLKKTGQFLRLSAAGLLASVLALGIQGKAYAAETEDIIMPDAVMQDEIIAEDVMTGSEQETISIEFPVFSEDEKSPFDFILDPQGLINATNAVRYGGRSFEEGATLYFENTNGEYDFSGTSDFLSIINRSSIPVKVSVNARLDDMEEISLSGDASFTDMQSHLYLALVDDRGLIIPFDKEGKAQIVYEMECRNEEGYAVYSFALTGTCNPNADWSRISVKPHITVSWTAEPMAEEEEESEKGGETEEEEKAAEDLEECFTAETEASKGEEISKEETKEEASPEEETKEEAAPEEETKEEAAPEEETKEEAAPGEETKEEAAPEEETKEEAAPGEETKEEATPGEETKEEAASEEKKETEAGIPEESGKTEEKSAEESKTREEKTETDSGDENLLESTGKINEDVPGSLEMEGRNK